GGTDVSDLATTIRSSVEPDEWRADWDDVLRRAGRSPSRPRRAAAIGLLVAVVLVLTLPGIGVGGRLKELIAGEHPPGLELRAVLTLANGDRIGTVSVRTTRLFVAASRRTGEVKPNPFTPAGHGPLQPIRMKWTI